MMHLDDQNPTLQPLCVSRGKHRLIANTLGDGLAVNTREMAEHTGTAIERLTRGQIECLLLVQQHLTSKEIATRLGISPHTVDQRVRLALRTLGCKSRFHAAQLLSAEHSPAAMLHWDAAPNEPYVEQFRPRPKGRRGSPPLPFATSGNPINEMTVALRLLWILVIACGAAFSMGFYLAGLESLARLMQGS